MPLPKPTEGEGREAFLERCTSDPSMLSEYADNDQRLAVCAASYEGEETGMEGKIALGEPQKATVLERRDDGSGRVQMPLLRVHAEIDFTKTAGGGPEKGKITLTMLRQMVSSFDSIPGPVPIGFSDHTDDRSGPAPGFIESVFIDGEVLWGVLDLNVMAMSSVVDFKEWRGFSIEAVKDREHPTGTIGGWSVRGGIFTNAPATDTHFRIAASGEEPTPAMVAVAHTPYRQEEAMAPEANESKELKDLQAKIATDQASITELTAKVEAGQAENARLSAKLTEATKKKTDVEAASALALQQMSVRDARIEDLEKTNDALRTERDEITAKHQVAVDAQMAEKVVAAITRGVEAGLPPSMFAGHEDNPALWLKTNYGGNLATLETIIEHTPHAKSVAMFSGRTPIKADGRTDKVTEETAAALRRLGLDPKFAKVADAEALAELKTKE